VVVLVPSAASTEVIEVKVTVLVCPSFHWMVSVGE
jgi:hypothetical protein